MLSIVKSSMNKRLKKIDTDPALRELESSDRDIDRNQIIIQPDI